MIRSAYYCLLASSSRAATARRTVAASSSSVSRSARRQVQQCRSLFGGDDGSARKKNEDTIVGGVYAAHDEDEATEATTTPTFSSYEYPLAKEQPVITRTKAIDVDYLNNASNDANGCSKKQMEKEVAANDPFDDAHQLSRQQVEEIKRLQKESLKTTLSGLVKNSSSSSSSSSISMAITSKIPPHIPPNVPASQLARPETLVTTLDNGVRVVSQETYGQVSTVGVVSNVGSRHETVAERGVTNLLEALSFGATRAHPSGRHVTNLLQDWGGTWFATAGREQSMHCIDLLRPNVDKAVEMLHQVLLEPLFLPDEVDDAKRALTFQNMDLPPELLLGEALQEAAFGSDQELGQAHFCKVEQINQLSVDTVQQYWTRQFLQNPKGMVLAGAGVQHDAFCELATAQFGHLQEQQQIDDSRTSQPSVYRGGEARVQLPSLVDEHGDPTSNSAASAAADSSPHGPLVRIALALPVGGWHSTADLVPTCVLQTLLGGGNAFSAGGPGKGMYSRLYRQVLNQYAWAESAEAFTAFHSECGLWGITGSTVPHKARDMVQVFAQHLARLATDPVSDQELSRAKNMLLNNVLTQLESRLVLFEDLGRQVLTYGHREDLQETCRKIQAVTPEDLQQLASRALQNNNAVTPTLVSVGHDLSHVPLHEEVVRWFR
jgi:mitochondrial-processing peptidase subunit alpha